MENNNKQAAGTTKNRWTGLLILILLVLLIAGAVVFLVLNGSKEAPVPAGADDAPAAADATAKSVIARTLSPDESYMPYGSDEAPAGPLEKGESFTGTEDEEADTEVYDVDIVYAADEVSAITGEVVTPAQIVADMAEHSAITGREETVDEYVAYIRELYAIGGEGDDASAFAVLPESVPPFADFISCAADKVTKQNAAALGEKEGSWVATVTAQSDMITLWIDLLPSHGWTESGEGVYTDGSYNMTVTREDGLDETETMRLVIVKK